MKTNSEIGNESTSNREKPISTNCKERERICEETLDDGEGGGGEEEDRRERWRREYRGIGFGTKSAGR